MFAAAARDAEKGPTAAAIAATVGGKRGGRARRVAASLLFESLIHDINALRGMLGEPDEVLSAHVWRGGMAQTSLTRFPGDVRVSLSWIYAGGLKHYEERLRFVGPKPPRRARASRPPTCATRRRRSPSNAPPPLISWWWSATP